MGALPAGEPSSVPSSYLPGSLQLGEGKSSRAALGVAKVAAEVESPARSAQPLWRGNTATGVVRAAEGLCAREEGYGKRLPFPNAYAKI